MLVYLYAMDLFNDYIYTLKFSTNLKLATTKLMGSRTQQAHPTGPWNLHYLKATFSTTEFLEPYLTARGADSHL